MTEDNKTKDKSKDYYVIKYPLYTITFYNGLEKIEEKFYDTIEDAAKDIGEDFRIIHKAFYRTQCIQKTHTPFKASKNLLKYEIVCGDLRTKCYDISEIVKITGDYFRKIKKFIIPYSAINSVVY